MLAWQILNRSLGLVVERISCRDVSVNLYGEPLFYVKPILCAECSNFVWLTVTHLAVVFKTCVWTVCAPDFLCFWLCSTLLCLTESRRIRLYACLQPVIVQFGHRNGTHAHTLPSESLPAIGLEIDLIVGVFFFRQSGQKLSKPRLLLYLLLSRNLLESPQYFTWISSVQPHSAPFLLCNWMSSRPSSPLSAHDGAHRGTAGNLVFRWDAVKENAC